MRRMRRSPTLWFALAWSAIISGALLLYAADIHAAWRRWLLLVPVLASVLPVVPCSPKLHRLLVRIGFVASAMVAILAIFSVGALYLPTAFALFLATDSDRDTPL